MGFPGGTDGKESVCIAGDPSLIPGLGRSPGEGNGNQLQYSCLENSMDRGAWQATSMELQRAGLNFYIYVCVYVYTYTHTLTGEGNGTSLQYSCLENPMDGEVWWAAVHGVAKSQTRLSDFPFTFHFHALMKEVATHSSVLAWRIPGTAEPGGLPSLGPHRVGHN